MFGSHCVKNWSSTQAIIALSSGEAEYYGVVKASSIGLGAQAMFKDMGVNVSIDVYTDAEAAKGIASRTGLGKTRHIDVHYLWVQEKVRNGAIKLYKVRGSVNPADLMTKHLTAPVLNKLVSIFGFGFQDGRSELTPAI